MQCLLYLLKTGTLMIIKVWLYKFLYVNNCFFCHIYDKFISQSAVCLLNFLHDVFLWVFPLWFLLLVLSRVTFFFLLRNNNLKNDFENTTMLWVTLPCTEHMAQKWSSPNPIAFPAPGNEIFPEKMYYISCLLNTKQRNSNNLHQNNWP